MSNIYDIDSVPETTTKKPVEKCHVCHISIFPRRKENKHKQVWERPQNEKYVCGCGKATCKIHRWPNHKCPLDYYEQS